MLWSRFSTPLLRVLEDIDCAVGFQAQLAAYRNYKTRFNHDPRPRGVSLEVGRVTVLGLLFQATAEKIGKTELLLLIIRA